MLAASLVPADSSSRPLLTGCSSTAVAWCVVLESAGVKASSQLLAMLMRVFEELCPTARLPEHCAFMLHSAFSCQLQLKRLASWVGFAIILIDACGPGTIWRRKQWCFALTVCSRCRNAWKPQLIAYKISSASWQPNSLLRIGFPQASGGMEALHVPIWRARIHVTDMTRWTLDVYSPDKLLLSQRCGSQQCNAQSCHVCYFYRERFS